MQILSHAMILTATPARAGLPATPCHYLPAPARNL